MLFLTFLQGKKRKKLEGLKLGPTADGEEVFEPVLDAEFVDVFKGTHGVVFLFDVTKMWTFEYIDRELPKVPAHIPGSCLPIASLARCLLALVEVSKSLDVTLNGVSLQCCSSRMAKILLELYRYTCISAPRNG